MEKQQIAPELIEQLKQFPTIDQEFSEKFGQVEIQIQALELFKRKLTLEFEKHQENKIKLTETLQSKYGDGNINLETGEFTPIK